MNKDIYKCPVCDLDLTCNGKQYVCIKGHSFDLSQKGYINLLLANNKKTKDPGDNKQMMQSRKEFLNKGYYKRLSCGINDAILQYLKENTETILDAGCGEGYYLSNLKNSIKEIGRSDISLYGMDISKSAVNMAASRDKDISFIVGSSFNIPVKGETVDFIIRNFAPGDSEEFRRILKKNGKLLVVTPGVMHLFQLKEALYEKARKNEEKDGSFQGFKAINHREIKYEIELSDNFDIKNLVSMTPYYWSISDETRNSLDTINFISTTLHFNVDIYEKI